MKDLRSSPCRRTGARLNAAAGRERASSADDFEALLLRGREGGGEAATVPAQRSTAKPGAPPTAPGWWQKKRQPEVKTTEVESDLRGTAAPPATAKAPAAVDSAKPAAPAGGGASLVQQVAAGCLTAIRVHAASGRCRVELSLDLGPLGAAWVSLGKTAGGAVEIFFHMAETEGRRLLADRLPELAQSLARQGVEVGELRLTSGAGAVWKADRPAAPPAVAGAPPGRTHDGSSSDGRSRGQYVQPEPESEGT